MDRKAIANETIEILRQGFYEYKGKKIEILEEQNHTKYWLFKQMDLSYQNFNRMVTNQTQSIRFENLDKLSDILGCPIGDLFEKTPEPNEE